MKNKWQKRTNASDVGEVVRKRFGVASDLELNDWFRKSRSGAYAIKGLPEAVRMIQEMPQHTLFAVCGDYDADGICATSIIVTALNKIGRNNVMFRIPKRHTEGFGLNSRIIGEVRKEQEDLQKQTQTEIPVCLITVDNGISAIEPVAEAKGFGWTVIVTDHHLAAKNSSGELILPEADLIMDPSALPDTADFAEYCGAALAYRIAAELIGRQNARPLMVLAAVATFADVMPLREENYVFARDGLKYWNAGLAVPGIQALTKENELSSVCDTDILFQIAPQINAPGRLYDNGAKKVVTLLTSENMAKALPIAREIVLDNKERKRLVAETVSVMDGLEECEDIYIRYFPSINTGIVGILAGQACEKTGRPAIILTESPADPDLLVGSGRSIEGVHLGQLLTDAAGTMERFGGHAGAAGVSVKKENLDAFIAAVSAALPKHDHSQKQDVWYYDLDIRADEVAKTIAECEKYAPYGEGNRRPVFRVTDFIPTKYAGSYVREIGTCGAKLQSKCCNAVSFSMRNEMRVLNSSYACNFIGTLSMNRYRGFSTPQIEVIDFEHA